MATGRVPTTANSPLTAKGDLFTYSTASARLAVGNNGESLVADSSTSTGLRYTALFGANKNKIINGDFFVNQRAFTSNTTNGTFNFDRWQQVNSGGTWTLTPQTFTLGAAPVAGYEGKTYLQGITASQSAAGDYAIFQQNIESVRTLAGQTATVSFWAKAATGTPKIAVEFNQGMGTGGSPSADVQAYAGQVTLSTSWVRYSLSVAIPSLTGKTLGTAGNDGLSLFLWTSAGSTFNSRTGSLGIQNNTFSIWGVQVEAGSVATAFQTATGTLQGELAACQRYLPSIQASTCEVAAGQCYSTTKALYPVPFQVTARVAPTGITVNAAANFSVRTANASRVAVTALAFSLGATNCASIEATVASGLVAGNSGNLFNEGSGTILFTGCEL